MFTGIVQDIGMITDIEPRGSAFLLSVRTHVADKVKHGSSVSVSGVCLSVLGMNGGVLTFELSEATLTKTNLRLKKQGDRINVEPSLKMGEELCGHFVFGHVDGLAEVLSLKESGQGALISVQIPEDLRFYLAPQGSITLDGVSLTIAALHDSLVELALVSDTRERSTLGRIKKGDLLNVECDMLAKYAVSAMERFKPWNF